MSQNPDDLEAVRTIVKALEPFEAKDQERIIRWAREKLGLSTSASPLEQASTDVGKTGSTLPGTDARKAYASIKDFVKSKDPQTDNQLAATVAYYYRFEAPEAERKQAIAKEDIRNACRLADIDRLHRPEQTLVNAFHAGLLNKGSERGSYAINSVGENLVAMTLPASIRPTSKQVVRRSTKPTSSKAVKRSKK